MGDSKGGGKLGAHNTILDQSYVQDHVQLYRDVVERVIRPWDSTPDNTVGQIDAYEMSWPRQDVVLPFGATVEKPMCL